METERGLISYLGITREGAGAGAYQNQGGTSNVVIWINILETQIFSNRNNYVPPVL